MPTIKEKLNFNFAGINASDFGLIHIVTDNGMYTDTLVASRDITETEIRGSNKPMLHSVQETPLEFEMTLAFEKPYTSATLDAVIRWLFVDHYRPLYFEGSEDKVFMAMPTGSAELTHNGLNEGYFTITMRCDSSNLYSPFITTPLVTVDTTSTITVVSNSHYDVYPEISFKKIGAGHVTIESLDDDKSIFEVRDLTDQEDIYINCQKEIIQTDAVGIYRYDKIIGTFPRLVFGINGINRFKVTGKCAIQFRYKNKYRF